MSKGQPYIYTVYNYHEGRNHTFRSKTSALSYYYQNELRCSSVDKRYN